MGKKNERRLVTKFGPDVVYMTTGGFEFLVDKLGGSFLGFSARASYGDSLLVIRAEFEERPMVAFVSSETVAGAIARAHRELRHNKVTWKADKFSNNRK